jgi:hypothetical protein
MPEKNRDSAYVMGVESFPWDTGMPAQASLVAGSDGRAGNDWGTMPKDRSPCRCACGRDGRARFAQLGRPQLRIR